MILDLSDTGVAPAKMFFPWDTIFKRYSGIPILRPSLFKFPSSESISQPFKEESINEEVRIGNITIFHLGTVRCDISGEVAGETLDYSWEWKG